MNSKQQIRSFAALVVLAVLAACSAPPPALDLDGTEWILTSVNGAGLLPGTNITLDLAQGKVSGFSGCNAYGGRYTASDGTLQVSQLAITAMACAAPPAVMQQEEAYTGTLQNAAGYRITDDRLEITDPGGVTALVFKKRPRFAMNPKDLLGTKWQLATMNGAKLIAGSTITLEFVSESQASGHAGCRDYTGTYTATEDEIKFPESGMNGDVCPSNALLEQEGNYTTILSWVTNYRLSKDQLELFSARGEVLIYAPLPSPLPTPTHAAASNANSHSGELGKLAYISEGDLWVRGLPDGEPKRLTTNGGNNSPLWSPSGEWIALPRSGGKIWVMRETGKDATAMEGSSAGGNYAWSPVIDTLAFVTGKGSLSTATAPDWRPQAIIDLLAPFAWSPDG